MQVTNNTSPSFGSIQVNISKMNNYQRGVSNKLFRAIKYSENYSPIAEKDVDIYFLPSKGDDIEVRFMDPYSGRFFRDKDNKIIRQQVGYSGKGNKFWNLADSVIENFRKMVTGEIERPKANVHKVVIGETEMTRINPAKTDEDVYEHAQSLMKELDYTQEEAEQSAFEQYKHLYHIDNKDADF